MIERLGTAEYGMENELPEGLRSDIRAAVTPILEAARKAGWSFNSIDWESKGSRTVVLTAKSPSGTAVYLLCGEKEFTERLNALLGNN